jgi:predicted esterase
MTTAEFAHGRRFDPIAKGPPEALVILFGDLGLGAATLNPVAVRWATRVPSTAFIVLDRVIQPAAPSGDPLHTKADRDASAEPAALDRAALNLGSLLQQHLRSYRLHADQLVLAGFRHGGTLALRLLLRQGWRCAGVLAFAAKLTPSLPRYLNVEGKVRLIECAENRKVGQSNLRVAVALLAACGIDARGALLTGPILSDEAIRHGGAYLAELVATAQRTSGSFVRRGATRGITSFGGDHDRHR